MSGTISSDVVNTFGKMLGSNISNEETKRIISKLEAESGAKNLAASFPRFTNLAVNLNVANVMMYTDTAGQIEINSVTDRIKRIGGGAYGTIFLGESGIVYKRITMESINNIIPDKYRNYLNELFHRELFIEAFVQTLLQCDTRYGNNIARIDGIYKDSIVDETNNLPLSQRKYTYYYKMENVPYTLPAFVKTLPNVISTMVIEFQELGTMLEYFMDTYGFFHRDLHGGNIMFDNAGNIKLIDFGMSCVQVDGSQYSVNNDECMSFDLFILITYLLEQNDIPVLNSKFRELLSDEEGFDIYALMKRFSGPKVPIFHKSYFSYSIKPKVQPWSDGVTGQFIEKLLPRLDPKGFVQFWKDYEVSLAPAVAVPVKTINKSKTLPPIITKTVAPVVTKPVAPVVTKPVAPNITKTKPKNMLNMYDQDFPGAPKFGYVPPLQKTIPPLNPAFKAPAIPGFKTIPPLKPEFKLNIPAYRTMALPVKGGKTRKVRKLRKKKSRSLA